VPGIYAWYVIPASPQQVFEYYMEELRALGWDVFTNPEATKLQLSKGMDAVTIDIYEGSDYPGYDTTISMFWYNYWQ